MSKLQEQLKGDLKGAMKSKDELTLSVLRLLLSAVSNKEISMRKEGKAELKDGEVMAVIKSEVKKRKDAIEDYIKGGRQELADKEVEEIKILEKYLPEQMSDEELEKIVRDVIAEMGEVGMSDFGKAMGAIMGKTRGQADGSKVSELVKKVLKG